MKNLFSTLTLTVTLALGGDIVMTEQAAAQSLGLQTVLSGVPIPPLSTNLFLLNYSTTNAIDSPVSGIGLTTNNPVFIGCADIDYLGISLQSVVPTNATIYNLSTVTVRASTSIDGTTTNGTPLVFTLNVPVASQFNSTATNASGVFTNFYNPACTNIVLDVHGLAGIYIWSLESTNAQGTGGPTNLFTLKVNPKAAKVEAIPSTTTN